MVCSNAGGLEMKTLILSQGQTAKVSNVDYKWASRWKWCAWWNCHTDSFYAVRSISKSAGGPSTVWLHKALMSARGFKVHGKRVDHKNHDTLDNCRRNLRVVTSAENSANRKGATSANKSGYLGVGWDSRLKKWRTQITVRGRYLHIGYFDSPLAAAKARDRYIRAHRLTHHTFNFPRARCA